MVKVYSKNNCIQCKMTKELLKQRNVNFLEINVDNVENKDALSALKEKGIKSLPYVETEIKSWTGFRPAEIKAI